MKQQILAKAAICDSIKLRGNAVFLVTKVATVASGLFIPHKYLLSKNLNTRTLWNFVAPCEPNALASGAVSGFGPGVARSSGILLMPDASANGSQA